MKRKMARLICHYAVFPLSDSSIKDCSAKSQKCQIEKKRPDFWIATSVPKTATNGSAAQGQRPPPEPASPPGQKQARPRRPRAQRPTSSRDWDIPLASRSEPGVGRRLCPHPPAGGRKNAPSARRWPRRPRSTGWRRRWGFRRKRGRAYGQEFICRQCARAPRASGSQQSPGPRGSTRHHRGPPP